MGRPSEYGPDIAVIICDRLAEGETLRAICRDDDMPGQRTVFSWLRQHVEFRQQYTLAREAQADSWADEIIEIADDGTNDFKPGGAVRLNGMYAPTEAETDPKLNAEHIQRSKLRVDARKWLMSKAAPKKYGDRIENVHTTPEGGAPTFTFKLDRPAQS